MRKPFKRILSLFLCVVTLCSICVIPAAAVNDDDGTYVIHSLVMETGSDTACVRITSEGSSMLYVALYDSESGQMLGIGSKIITEPVVEWEVRVTVSCTKDETASVKAFLLDSMTLLPLCRSVTEDESETADLGKKTVYSITDAKMQNIGGQARAAVTVNVNAPSILNVSFYADDELENINAADLHDPIAAVSVGTPDYCEMETLYLSVTSDLPEHFIILAELKDATGNLLTDPYVCVNYTSQYAQYREKTVEDVTAEYEGTVLNFDGDTTTNFGVLNPSVITVSASTTVNVLNVVESDPEDTDTGFIVPDFTYCFSCPDETVSSLQPGDCVYIEETEYLFMVGSITVADGVVVITPADDAELTDFYDFLKVDLHSYEADDEEPRMFLAAQGSLGTSFTESINWHPGGDDDITVSGELSISEKTDIKIACDVNLFKDSYFEFSLKPTTTLTLKGTVSAEKSTSDSDEKDKEAKDELSVAKLKLPSPVPGLSVYIKPSFEVDLTMSGSVSVEFESKDTTGFTYTSKSGIQKVDKKESSAKLDSEVKLELTIGPKITVGASFIEMIDASVSVQAGLKISLSESTDIVTSEERDYHHACAFCLDGTAKWFLTADAKLKIDVIGEKLDYKKSWNIVKFEGWISLFKDPEGNASEEAGKFYISIINAASSPFGGKPKIGSGTCPNKQWKTVFQTADKDNNTLAGIMVNVTGQEGSAWGKTFTGETEFFAYLYDGVYVATGVINGVDVRKEFEVDGKKQTVRLKAGSSSDSIPDDAVYFNGHAYLAFDQLVTWKRAKELCEAMGGHLATIATEEEQNFIAGYTKELAYVWLGYQYDWSEWITGEEVTYTNWGYHEPDGHKVNGRYPQKYCALCNVAGSGTVPEGAWSVEAGQWDDKAEIEVCCFICEWDT